MNPFFFQALCFVFGTFNIICFILDINDGYPAVIMNSIATVPNIAFCFSSIFQKVRQTRIYLFSGFMSILVCFLVALYWSIVFSHLSNHNFHSTVGQDVIGKFVISILSVTILLSSLHVKPRNSEQLMSIATP